MAEDTQGSKELMRLDVTFEDRHLRLVLGEYTGHEEFILQSVTGFTVAYCFLNPAAYTLAALIWLHDRRDDPSLTYEEVAKRVTYTVVESLDDDTPEGETPPEA